MPDRTVRYYDRIALVSPQERSEAGYRLYSAEEEGKLRFVRQAKALGFSLEDIRQLIAVAERGGCGQLVPELHRLLSEKVADIDRRIYELRAFRQRLLAYGEGKAAAAVARAMGLSADAWRTLPCFRSKTGGHGVSDYGNPEGRPRRQRELPSEGVTWGGACGFGEADSD